jgi:hypothetical protein
VVVQALRDPQRIIDDLSRRMDRVAFRVDPVGSLREQAAGIRVMTRLVDGLARRLEARS